MAQITVAPREKNHSLVTVKEGASSTTHEVSVTPEHLNRYAGQETSPANPLQASFEFLLEHEPKESILPKFELSTIERYFPEYLRQIREKL